MLHANIAVLDSVEWKHEFGRCGIAKKMMNLWKLVENRRGNDNFCWSVRVEARCIFLSWRNTDATPVWLRRPLSALIPMLGASMQRALRMACVKWGFASKTLVGFGAAPWCDLTHSSRAVRVADTSYVSGTVSQGDTVAGGTTCVSILALSFCSVADVHDSRWLHGPTAWTRHGMDLVRCMKRLWS